MQDTSRAYFEDRIRTASPERLQLMLLEAALQAARRAEQALLADRALQANVDLAQAEAILSEILGAMNKQAAPQLVDRVAGVYAFMVRRLTDAHLSGDVTAVRDAIRVLEVEHETWRQVCERPTMAERTPAPHLPAFQSGFSPSPTPASAFDSGAESGGFAAFA